MNSQNHNDLVPRPSPKPSQIEVPIISNGPEVPEVSLLFDSNFRKITESARMQVTKNSIDQQKTFENMQIPLYSKQFDNERHFTTKRENCCCGVLNSESYRLNGHANSMPPHLDYTRSNQNVHLDYNSKNEMYARNQFSNSMPYTKQCVPDYKSTANANQSFITLDEYQSMVSQFTKMILNLNYKFNQVLDNSISREELNQITRKFELHIENLTQHVKELNSKLEKASSELVSQNAMEYKCYQRNNEPLLMRRHAMEHKCCPVDDRPLCNFNEECNDHQHVSEQPQKQVQAQKVMKMCLRSSGQQQCDHEHKDHGHANMEDGHKDRIPSGRMSPRGGMTIDSISENANLEHEMANLKLQQESRRHEPCYSNHEQKLPTNNLVPSSDVSDIMNTLAVKYISKRPSDTSNQEYRQEHDLISRNDCNNVSIATFQFMERYQLLPSAGQKSIKSLGVNKTRASLPNEQQFNYQKALEGNDQSFLR